MLVYFEVVHKLRERRREMEPLEGMGGKVRARHSNVYERYTFFIRINAKSRKSPSNMRFLF